MLYEGNIEPRTVHVTESCPPAMSRAGTWRLEDFELHKQLYKGKASLLYRATCRLSGLPVALKLYRKLRLSALNWYQVCGYLDRSMSSTLSLSTHPLKSVDPFCSHRYSGRSGYTASCSMRTLYSSMQPSKTVTMCTLRCSMQMASQHLEPVIRNSMCDVAL